AGDLLAVRSDATLFLAKQVARMLADEQLPLRVYYAESILRPEDREDISRNEFFQIGGELIGHTGRHGDLETATLLMRLLDSILPGRSVLHIGSRKLVNTITSGFSDEAAAEFREALALHDSERLEGFFAGSGGDTHKVLRFLFNIGSARETGAALAELEKSTAHLPEDFFAAARDTIETAEVLEAVIDGERVRVDFSESGSQSYHTGVAFRAYAPGAEAAVASGGRYDSLYGHFGLETEAVGFSIMLRRLEKLTDPGSLPDIQTIADDRGSFPERLAKAEQLRRQGTAVRL
ncbi:MAG: ATP phosphoribosyltransferase regulatory subunit, partial [Spirochaetales bacterium]